MKKVTKPIEQKPIPLASLKEELLGDINQLESDIDDAFALDEMTLEQQQLLDKVKNAVMTAIGTFQGRLEDAVKLASIDFDVLVKDKDNVDMIMDALESDGNFSESAKGTMLDMTKCHFPELKIIELQTLDQEMKFDAFMEGVIFPHYNEQQAFL